MGRHLFALGALLVSLEFVLPVDVRVWTLRVIASIGFVLVLIDSWRTANRLERERRSAASPLPK